MTNTVFYLSVTLSLAVGVLVIEFIAYWEEKRWAHKPFTVTFEFKLFLGFGFGAMLGWFIFPGEFKWCFAVGSLGVLLIFLRRQELTTRERRAQTKIFPAFLDLLSLGLSSGLNMKEAWRSAVSVLPSGPAMRVLSQVPNGFERGLGAGAVFNELRSGLLDDRLKSIVVLLQESLKHGGEIQDSLRAQAHTLRQQHFQELEKQAQTIGLKLLLPIFLFIVPPVFLILFGPLAIRYSQGGYLLF